MNELTLKEKEQIRLILDKQSLDKGAPIYAGFWKRYWAASLIDGLFLTIADILINAFFLKILHLTIAKSMFSGLFLLLVSLSDFLFGWLYYAIMESSSYQATIGKMAFGIMVTDLNGNRISFFKASNRYFAKVLSALLLGFGFIIAGFTPKKQALHDIIAGCLVVKGGKIERMRKLMDDNMRKLI
jgi:uncharacterized RDD family membrane protein YckC